MPKPNKSSPATVRGIENRMKAVELRMLGLSYRKIGAKMDLSEAQAHRLVKSAMEMAIKKTAEDAEVAIAIELDRLDQLFHAHIINALKGNTAATDRVLKVMERRAKLLGLDAPTKIRATDKDGDDAVGGVFVVPAPAASVDEWLEQAAQYQANKKPATQED